MLFFSKLGSKLGSNNIITFFKNRREWNAFGVKRLKISIIFYQIKKQVLPVFLAGSHSTTYGKLQFSKDRTLLRFSA